MVTLVWVLAALNVLLLLGLVVFMYKTFRRPQDDPRLSRGLQLLQSKISILEDISDRTEVQVKQLMALMDQKIKEVHQKVQLADKHIHLVKASMEKSREVAKIFEDRIPHQEIIERQTTANYVKAAKMAHRGASVDEIMGEVPLPRAEVELLLKLNRQQLMFSEEQLPEWIRERVESSPSEHLGSQLKRVEFEFDETQGPRERDFEEALEPPQFEMDSLKALGEKFRQACNEVIAPLREGERSSGDKSQGLSDTLGRGDSAPDVKNDSVVNEKVAIRRVQFPRLQL